MTFTRMIYPSDKIAEVIQENTRLRSALMRPVQAPALQVQS